LFRGISSRQRPELLVLPPGPLLPQHVVAESERERTGYLKFILNIFVDKKQVPILWDWKLPAGLNGIFAGLTVIQHPIWSAILLPTMLVIMFVVNGIIHLKDVKLITAAIPEKGSDELIYFKSALDIYEIAVAKALEHLELHNHQKDVFADSS
jgi:hypothetical protein